MNLRNSPVAIQHRDEDEPVTTGYILGPETVTAIEAVIETAERRYGDLDETTCVHGNVTWNCESCDFDKDEAIVVALATYRAAVTKEEDMKEGRSGADNLRDALAEINERSTDLNHTPNANLPPLVPDGPRRTMLVKIEVSADFTKRLDNQWEVEREIHADRWSWSWAVTKDDQKPSQTVGGKE